MKKKKILIIGPYKDGSGWSNACLGLMKSINLLPNIDLAARCIKLNRLPIEVEQEISLLEKKDVSGAEAVIQFTTPENLVYDSRAGKNYGYSFIETDSIINSGWIERYSLMDELLVPNEFTKNTFLRSGFKKPISVVPCGIDISKFRKSYKKYGPIEKAKNGDFLFYTIADFNPRKNIECLITAFHNEFSYNEPVNLCLKISKVQSSNYGGESLEDIISNCKKRTGRRSWKNEIILDSGFISDDEMCSIHKSCDVFCLPTRGESLCIPAIEAMAFGKAPIVTGWSSPSEYINNSNGWLVDYRLENCNGMQDFSANIYSTEEKWADPSPASLQKCMREAYENRKLLKEKSKQGIVDASKFSYKASSLIIQKVLNNEPKTQN